MSSMYQNGTRTTLDLSFNPCWTLSQPLKTKPDRTGFRLPNYVQPLPRIIGPSILSDCDRQHAGGQNGSASRVRDIAHRKPLLNYKAAEKDNANNEDRQKRAKPFYCCPMKGTEEKAGDSTTTNKKRRHYCINNKLERNDEKKQPMSEYDNEELTSVHLSSWLVVALLCSGPLALHQVTSTSKGFGDIKWNFNHQVSD
ncbi:hypothetical protein LSTR_LSTR006341, partial [Laodelphax striatellus]